MLSFKWLPGIHLKSAIERLWLVVGRDCLLAVLILAGLEGLLWLAKGIADLKFFADRVSFNIRCSQRLRAKLFAQLRQTQTGRRESIIPAGSLASDLSPGCALVSCGRRSQLSNSPRRTADFDCDDPAINTLFYFWSPPAAAKHFVRQATTHYSSYAFNGEAPEADPTRVAQKIFQSVRGPAKLILKGELSGAFGLSGHERKAPHHFPMRAT